ncbi:type II CAAX prenyl endopeptidase Rce1 family protein [Dysgonomonas sp. 520]|uniref:CPBP family glutamic-type intramembrane protease n=1 Tax=Dysgonomonas sp. 520 TaxID=2302931 RepID=UPI0013D762CA|nr:CPBP family glutamic-type intramembrane protease [Dysgonomonas sp. 520]NDW10044.1 CPBP family intramembrane metalloprotease [Dysgonomonas sp. 520]
MKDNQVDKDKVRLFLALTFSLSWLVAALVYFTDTKADGIMGSTLISLFYLMSPAIAAFSVQRLMYGENLQTCGFCFFKNKTRWYFIIPALFILIYALMFGIINLLGIQFHLSQFGMVNLSGEVMIDKMLASMPEIPPGLVATMKQSSAQMSGTSLLISFFFGIIFRGFTLGMLFSLGEELGWRGFLLRETQKAGFLRSSLFIGLVWGIWYIPLVLLGLYHQGHTGLGVFLMVLFTISATPILIYIRLKMKTVLAPAALISMLTSMIMIMPFIVDNYDETYSSIIGVAGIITTTIVSVAIFALDKKFVKDFENL